MSHNPSSLAASEGAIGHHYPRNPQSGSFKLIKIGVGCRMTQRSTHSDDLALVVKCMGQDMVKDECRSANGDVSIGEMKFFGGVKLLIRQS
jgi:hypothetical protein